MKQMKRKKCKRIRPVMSDLMSKTLDEEFVDAVAVINGMDAAPMFGMVIEDEKRGDDDED